MEFFLSPDLAYLFLAAGMFFAAMAILSPGTGILELLALVSFTLAGWGVYNLPVNWWALLIILVGVVLFWLAVHKPEQIVYLIVSIAALVAGSAYLFRSEEWYSPAVNPFLALAVSLFLGVFFWIVAHKAIEARAVQPAHDLKALIGDVGVAKTDIYKEGSVQVSGELWTARSDELIDIETEIRVVGREGFILVVEPSEPRTLQE